MNEEFVKKMQEVWVILSLILVGGLGFILGRIEREESRQPEVTIVYPPESAVVASLDQISDEDNSNLLPFPETQGPITASKNGTKYYTPGCSVTRIQEENRIYFASEEDAQAQGLEKSKTCK